MHSAAQAWVSSVRQPSCCSPPTSPTHKECEVHLCRCWVGLGTLHQLCQSAWSPCCQLGFACSWRGASNGGWAKPARQVACVEVLLVFAAGAGTCSCLPSVLSRTYHLRVLNKARLGVHHVLPCHGPHNLLASWGCPVASCFALLVGCSALLPVSIACGSGTRACLPLSPKGSPCAL